MTEQASLIEQLRVAAGCNHGDGARDSLEWKAADALERVERERDYAWGEMKNAQAYWRAETAHAEAAEAQVEALMKALEPFMPITVRETPDYAELTFGEHQTQAMTVRPDNWLKLSNLFAALASSTPESSAKAPKKTMCLTLTDEEMAALEELSKRKDLPGDRIFRQALKLYQLEAHGHVRIEQAEARSSQSDQDTIWQLARDLSSACDVLRRIANYGEGIQGIEGARAAAKTYLGTTSPPPSPVAWRVRDFADGWAYFNGEALARSIAREQGSLIEPLYALPTPPKAEGE